MPWTRTNNPIPTAGARTVAKSIISIDFASITQLPHYTNARFYELSVPQHQTQRARRTTQSATKRYIVSWLWMSLNYSNWLQILWIGSKSHSRQLEEIAMLKLCHLSKLLARQIATPVEVRMSGKRTISFIQSRICDQILLALDVRTRLQPIVDQTGAIASDPARGFPRQAARCGRTAPARPRSANAGP